MARGFRTVRCMKWYARLPLFYTRYSVALGSFCLEKQCWYIRDPAGGGLVPRLSIIITELRADQQILIHTCSSTGHSLNSSSPIES